MLKSKQLLITLILFLCSILDSSAQYETDWPAEGYTAYFTNDGTEILLRDSQGNTAGKMTLITPWLAQLDNISESFIYKEKYDKRLEFIDSNKNGVIDKIFHDDFSAYEFVDNPALPPLQCPYNVYGLQSKGGGLSGGFHAYFDTVETGGDSPPHAPVMILGDELNAQLNFQDAYILVDVKTEGIYEPIEKVFSPALKAKVLYNPLITHQQWRLQNYPYAKSEHNNPSCLYPLPSSKNGAMMSFNINDFIHCDNYPRQTGDFRYVKGISFFLLQTTSDTSGTQNDWDAKGSIKLNSISVSKDYKVNGSTPLDTQIFVSDIKADAFKPKNKITVSIDIFKKGEVAETVTDIMVFNPTFDLTNISASKIYDSSTVGQSIETHIGLGEVETVNFSFYLPQNAPQGNYRVFGVIKDKQGNILDTTGPDKSLNDRTILAYNESFSVTPFDQEGPVPLFDYFITDNGNGDVNLVLFAGMSFNYPSQNYQITSYEWDLDNDGHFEYQSGSPSQPVIFTSVDDSFVKPVALRVTNNHDPAQSAVTSKIIRIGRFGDLEINTSLIDNDSIASAKCLLYDSEHNYISGKIVNDSSVASWENLIAGDYIVEVYVYKNGIFPSVELACIEEVSVSAGNKSSYTVSRPALNIVSAQMVYSDTGLPVNPLIGEFPGTKIKLDVIMENNSPYDLYARTKLILDKNREGLIDVNVTLSDKILVPAGAQETLSTFFSLKQPEYNNDTYYYAFMVETEKNLLPVKVYEQNWQAGCSVIRFPSRAVNKKINFCGYNFDVIQTRRFSGITDNNVWFAQHSGDDIDEPSGCDEQGILHLKVQDYSGVGAEATSPYEQYHYGIYKSEMKVDGQATNLPEGTVGAFFYYWQQNSETELQEIDVEIRSLDKTKNGISSYVTFSVHSRLSEADRHRVVTHYCPVENIDRYHTYEFRWRPGEIAFYIDGLPAYNFNGEKAVVNDQSLDIEGNIFTGRVPNQPGRIIMNHWSGYWNNTWSGAPPQGKGDSILKIARISYTPLENFNNTAKVNIVKTKEDKIELKLKKGSWPVGCDIYSADILHPLDWQIMVENVSLTDKTGYIDQSSSEDPLKYYKVIPK